MKRVRLKLREDTDGSATEQAAPEPSFIPDGPLTHTILNDKLTRDFCELIEEGLPADSACNYLGIMPSTYWTWMRKGQRFLDGNEEPAEHRIYGAFVKMFRRATANYLRHVSKRMHLKTSPSWFRDMEILSRRDRKTWSRDEPAGGSDEQYDPDEKFM